jgi:hypothetical protein
VPLVRAGRAVVALDRCSEQLENTFETARRVGLITKTVIERRASEQRVPASLRELLRAVDARPKESKLEVKVARLLRSNGLRTRHLG